MIISKWRGLLGVLATTFVLALPAQAQTVDFSEIPPMIYAPGESFVIEGYVFTMDPLALGVVDESATFCCGNAPENADGQFLTILNSGAVAITSEAAAPFLLSSFDFSFVSPFGAIGTPGLIVGQLMISAVDINGNTVQQVIDFPGAGANGNFGFVSVISSELAFSAPLLSLTFASCLFDDNGVCVIGDNAAQFALDNIAFAAAAISEPGTLLLVIMALGLLALARRRAVR